MHCTFVHFYESLVLNPKKVPGHVLSRRTGLPKGARRHVGSGDELRFKGRWFYRRLNPFEAANRLDRADACHRLARGDACHQARYFRLANSIAQPILRR